MEPLSIITGIVGLVVAANQVRTALQQLASDFKDAASDAGAAMQELSTIVAIVQECQEYIENRKQASQQSKRITMEQITVPLAGLITTVSKMNELFSSLQIGNGMKIWDRTKWILKKDKLASLTVRLQSHKSTLALILGTLQNVDTDYNFTRLEDRVGEISLRLRTIEESNQSLTRAFTQRGSSDYIAVEAPTNANPPILSTLDEELNMTRVYRHAADNHSLFSCSTGRRTEFSLSSSVTLGEVSNLSVYALPVFASELSNAACYTLPESTSDSPPTGTSGPNAKDRPSPRWKPIVRRPKQIAARVDHESNFGVSLVQSFCRSNQPIWIHDDRDEPFIWGHVPTIVAKCATYVKQNSGNTECLLFGHVHETFDSLFEAFESSEGYGENIIWTGYTPCDAAAAVLYYLRQLPEPLIPHYFHNDFCRPLREYKATKRPDDLCARYTTLILNLPKVNRHLFLYILDLLASLERSSHVDGMSIAWLAYTFSIPVWGSPHSYPSLARGDDVLMWLIYNQSKFPLGLR